MIDEIKHALKNATPGPWEVDESEEGHEIRMGEAITNPGCYSSHLVIEYNHGVYPWDGGGQQFEEAEANAQLIANAPKWLGQLLKEKERLIKEVVKYRQESTNEREQSESIVAEREELYEQLKVLKLANGTLARDQVLMFEELNKCKQEDMNERILSEVIVSERKQLYIQVEEMKKALEWYADILTYKSAVGNHARISMDLGERARQALERMIKNDHN